MTLGRRSRDHLTIDNYADLLALAGIVRSTGRCAACGEHAAPVRSDALWMLHAPDSGDLAPTTLLCAKHAAEWTATGYVAAARTPVAP